MHAGEIERPPVARVGPNAVTQLAAALRAEGGEAAARDVFQAAGLERLLIDPPVSMIDQGPVARLHQALRDVHPAEAAERIAAEAGRRSADYLLAHRIPRPAQAVMRALPAWAAARILLSAIARNAWTFAGSGQVRVRAGNPALIEIAANPLAVPGCAWHEGVFSRLFADLVHPAIRIEHPSCCARGDATCRFLIFHGSLSRRTR